MSKKKSAELKNQKEPKQPESDAFTKYEKERIEEEMREWNMPGWMRVVMNPRKYRKED